MNISVRELARQIAALTRKVEALSRPQLAFSSIEDGSIEEYDREGNLVSRIGRQPDGSHGVVVLDGPDPLRTSQPIASATALAIAARWDGNFIDPDTGLVDANLPAYDDFEYIEVHVGDLVGFSPDNYTIEGYIHSRDGGEVVVPAQAGTRFVKFVTRSKAGKASVPSVATEVDVPALVDDAQFAQAQADLAEAQADLDAAQAALSTAFPTGAFNVAETIDAETAAAQAAAEAAAAIDAAAKADAAKDEAIAAAAADAQAKADAAASAAQTAAQEYADAEAEAARLAAIAAASDDATAKAAAAQAAAEAAAAADALAKAQAAEAAAIAEAESLAAAAEAAAKSHADTVSATAKAEALTEAAADAQAKADAAKTAAEAAAKQYADGAISASETAVLQQAASAAQDMADAAEAAAKQAAAIDAQQKANAAASAAEAAAKQYADGEIDAAALATAQQAAADAQAKADAARDAAIDAAAADAQAKADAAQALAQQHADGLFDDAMTAVNGKNLITYAGIARGATIPTTPPPTTGRVAGDIHRVRYTDNGEIAREWTLISGTWREVKFGDAILTSLDVGKLVAGTANVDTAVINKMAVQMADIIEADIGNLRVTGTSTMNTLVAQEIAAQSGEFLNLQANQIIGGDIEALIGFTTNGKFVAGDPNSGAVEISANGLSIWTTPRMNGTEPHYPLSHWGVGETTFSITDTVSPDAMISLSAEGAISGEHLSISNDPQFGGQLLMGAWAGRSGDRDSILWHMPWGVVKTINLFTNGSTVGNSIPDGVEQPLAWGTADLLGGRAYRISIQNAVYASFPISGANYHYIEGRIRFTTASYGSTPSRPSTSSAEIARHRLYQQGGQSTYVDMLKLSGIYQPTSDVTLGLAGTLRGSNASVGIRDYATNPWWLVVEDLGPINHSVGSSYSSAVPPVKKYTYYFNPVSVDQQQGSINSSFHWNGVYQNDKAIQGWNSSLSSGPYHTNVRFGGARSISGSASTGVSLADAVSGAQQIEVKLRVTSAWSERSSVRARIGWGSSDSNGPTTQVSSSLISPGGSATVSLGSAGSTFVKNNAGTLRIYIGPGSGSSNADLMGLYAMKGTSSQKMRLQVDVWK